MEEVSEPGSQMGRYNILVIAKNEQIGVIAPLGSSLNDTGAGNSPRRKTESISDCSIPMEGKVT